MLWSKKNYEIREQFPEIREKVKFGFLETPPANFELNQPFVRQKNPQAIPDKNLRAEFFIYDINESGKMRVPGTKARFSG